MKRVKEEQGFTLIEMLIVLLIISVLILIMIPNVTKHFNTIDNKGCSAYLKMIDSQIEAYRIEERNSEVTLENLQSAGYLNKENLTDGKLKCPNGKDVVIYKNRAYIDGEQPTENTNNKTEKPS